MDGEWTTDHQADKEDDGHSNINNVLHPENIKKVPAAAAISGIAADSSTVGLAAGVPKEDKAPTSAAVSGIAADSSTVGLAAGVPKEEKQTAPGAFPETPANESEPTLGVNPIPASSGVGNPTADSVNANTIDSTATTSKEDYEKAGSGAFPGTSGDATQFSVNPIPASSGIGNPVQSKPGEGVPEVANTNTVDSTVTTSKEDYEKAGSYGLPAAGAAVGGALAGAAAAIGFGSKEENKKNLIPESSLPMGASAGSDAGPHIQSAGPGTTTAALAAGVPLEKDRTSSGVPADASPEVIKEKEALEKELLSKVPASTAEGEHANPAAQTSYHGLATTVPETVEKSMEKANAPPEAAADTSVVAEKTQVEQELKSLVPKSNESGEPAPTVTAATSAVAPGASPAAAAAVSDGAGGEDIPAVKSTTTTADKSEGDATEYAPPAAAGLAPGVSSGAAAAISDGADPGLADEPAVKMMAQNESGAAPATTTDGAADTQKEPQVVAPPATTTTAPTESKPKEETKPAEPSSATSTPTKKATTGTDSPASTDKKKKHRISSFFKKVFN